MFYAGPVRLRYGSRLKSSFDRVVEFNGRRLAILDELMPMRNEIYFFRHLLLPRFMGNAAYFTPFRCSIQLALRDNDTCWYYRDYKTLAIGIGGGHREGQKHAAQRSFEVLCDAQAYRPRRQEPPVGVLVGMAVGIIPTPS